jgi:hypothetical protein
MALADRSCHMVDIIECHDLIVRADTILLKLNWPGFAPPNGWFYSAVDKLAE